MIGINPQPLVQEKKGRQSVLQALMFGGLGILLIAAPLGRGLYYYLEFTQAQMYLGLIFFLYGSWRYLQHDKQIQLGLLDLFLLLYLAANVLSLFTAVHIKDAVFGVIRALDYVILFFIVRDLTREISWRNRLVTIIFASSVLVSVVAFLGTMEFIHLTIPSFYNTNGLISTLEYVNAYAIIAAIGVVLGLGLLSHYSSLWIKSLVGMGVYLNGLGVLVSFSRATWILLAVIIITYLFLHGSKGFWKNFYFLALIIIVSMFTSKGYLEAVAEDSGQVGLYWLIAGISLVGLGTALINKLPHLLGKYRIKRHYSLVLPWIFALGIVAVGSVYISHVVDIFPRGGGQFVSGAIIDQVETIGGQDGSYQARLKMNGLAVQMILDRPLTGAGGGGWNALYHQYQDQFFLSSQVHNHYLQVGVETGLPGLLGYFGFWLALIIWAVRYFYKRRGKTSWPLTSSVGLALLLLLLHSAMDFELSMPAVAMILWCLGAMLRNQVMKKADAGKTLNVPILPVIVFMLIFSLASLGLGYREQQAQAYVQKGAQELEAGQYTQALMNYEKAATLSPYTGETAANLAQLYSYFYYRTKDEQTKSKAVEFAQRSIALTPNYIPGSQKIAQAYLFLGNKGARRIEQERLVQIAPKMVEGWAALAQTCLNEGIAFLEQQDTVSARTELEKCVTVMKQVEHNYTLAKKAGTMRPTPQLYLIAGQASLLLGQREIAQDQLTWALRSKDTKNLAGVWLTLSYEDSDEKKQASYFKQYIMNNSENLAIYNKIKKIYNTLN